MAKTNNKITERTKPNYYLLPNGIECKDVVSLFDFNVGSAIKYCWRSGRKFEEGIAPIDKEIEDLHKAQVCLDMRIEHLEKERERLMQLKHEENTEGE